MGGGNFYPQSLVNKGKNHKNLAIDSFCGFYYGFTLIEMLGIIVLLGLIGLIVYPTILKVINESKNDLYNKNISELERLAISWTSINDSKLPTVDKKGYYLKIEELKKDGFIDNDFKNPKTGEDFDGCVGIIYDKSKDKYNYQYYEDCTNFQKPTLSNLSFSTLENEYGWRNQDFYVTLESEYLDSYEYCIDDNKCEPNTSMNANESILVNQEGIKYVCAKGSNTVGDTTTECALYRLDKTKPLTGTLTINGTKGLGEWYLSDVTLTVNNGSDSLSGHASTTSSHTSITSNTNGTVVTVTTIDVAGNTSTRDYTIKINKDKPTEGTLVIDGTLGNNGWYVSDVNLSVTDVEGVSSTLNINKITSDTAGTNVIVTSTNTETGAVSTKTHTIKVDKTKPTAGTATFTGTMGSNSWYTSNVTVNVTDGSDSLSGHAGTTSSHTSITSNTSGTTITITTTDKAGNSSNRTYSVKVDKNSPTVTAKYSSVKIGSISQTNVVDLFTISYSTSGKGSVSCNVTKTANIKGTNNPLKCTATGGNGLSSYATITVINPLVSIAVATAPTKTVYKEGEAFNKSGMVIKATYKDGTTKNVTGYTTSMSKSYYDSRSNYRSSGYGIDYLKPGTNQTVTISYTENGVTKTTSTKISAYIYADQISNLTVAAANYDVTSITDWSGSDELFGDWVETSYKNDNDYGYLTVGSNYLQTTTKIAKYSADLYYNLYIKLTDGSYWYIQSGYEKDVTYSLTITQKLISSSGDYAWTWLENGFNFTSQNQSITASTFTSYQVVGGVGKTSTVSFRHTFSNFKVNNTTKSIVVEGFSS